MGQAKRRKRLDPDYRTRKPLVELLIYDRILGKKNEPVILATAFAFLSKNPVVTIDYVSHEGCTTVTPYSESCDLTKVFCESNDFSQYKVLVISAIECSALVFKVEHSEIERSLQWLKSKGFHVNELVGE